jgi:hypothetical protein
MNISRLVMKKKEKMRVIRGAVPGPAHTTRVRWNTENPPMIVNFYKIYKGIISIICDNLSN